MPIQKGWSKVHVVKHKHMLEPQMKSKVEIFQRRKTLKIKAFETIQHHQTLFAAETTDRSPHLQGHWKVFDSIEAHLTGGRMTKSFEFSRGLDQRLTECFSWGFYKWLLGPLNEYPWFLGVFQCSWWLGHDHQWFSVIFFEFSGRFSLNIPGPPNRWFLVVLV